MGWNTTDVDVLEDAEASEDHPADTGAFGTGQDLSRISSEENRPRRIAGCHGGASGGIKEDAVSGFSCSDQTDQGHPFHDGGQICPLDEKSDHRGGDRISFPAC